jgi:hypothetical protein
VLEHETAVPPDEPPDEGFGVGVGVLDLSVGFTLAGAAVADVFFPVGDGSSDGGTSGDTPASGLAGDSSADSVASFGLSAFVVKLHGTPALS